MKILAGFYADSQKNLLICINDYVFCPAHKRLPGHVRSVGYRLTMAGLDGDSPL